MRLLMPACLVMALCAADAALARDLLSKPVPRPPVRAVTASADVTLPEPFTTSPGRPGYTCSISGLGHTSRCTYRSWRARLSMAERFASR